MNEDRAAALLLRVWVEGESAQFRARLAVIDTSAAPGSDSQQQTIAVVASASDAVDAVRRWLEDFVQHVGQPIDSE